MIRKFIFVISAVIFLSAGWADSEERYGLSAGDAAPDFMLKSISLRNVALSQLYANGKVVLIFYRGGWCSYCSSQLRDFQQHYQAFKDRGIEIAAVSVDAIDSAAQTAAKDGLQFPVLSNPEADVLEKYHVLYVVPEDMAKVYKNEYGIDLGAASGWAHRKIAIPAIYVIDQTGTIIYAYVSPEYTLRKSAKEVLNILNGI